MRSSASAYHVSNASPGARSFLASSMRRAQSDSFSASIARTAGSAATCSSAPIAR